MRLDTRVAVWILASLCAGAGAAEAPPGSDYLAHPAPNLCPSREQLCPTAEDKKAKKPLPAIKHSISVRYCDKPVVVWVLIDDATLIRFDATNPPSVKDFPKIEDFVKWLDSVPNDVYDLPCVGEKAQKELEIPHDDGDAK